LKPSNPKRRALVIPLASRHILATKDEQAEMSHGLDPEVPGLRGVVLNKGGFQEGLRVYLPSAREIHPVDELLR